MLSATLKTVPSESKKPSLKKTLAKKRKAKKDGADAPAPKRAKRVNSWQKYEGKGTDEKKKRKKGDDTDAAHQTVHRTFVSKRLHEKADDAQAKELYVKPIRTYDQNTLAWLVANPKFIANRVCQQYLPGLVNVRFCRGQGLLLFHNEYAAKQLLKRKKVEIDGQGYELEAFQPKLHRQLKTLGKVFNNYGYKKYHPAVIKAQVTEISSRALTTRIKGLDIVNWEPDRRSTERLVETFCGAKAKFSSAASCQSAVDIGLFNIEGENLRVRPYLKFHQRNEEIRRGAVE
jgi:hypothetical protein